MGSKEVWESRWRVPIFNGIAWAMAILYPFLFRLLIQVPAKGVPASVALLQHYVPFAYTWFGEDLPELLLVYVIIWCIASIAREWQSGTVEFLAQLPLRPSQIALIKGLWGTSEIASVAVISSAVLWVASRLSGHTLPLAPYALTVLLMAVGFIGMLWLVSALAWALHSILSVVLVGVAIFAISLITGSVPPLKPCSPLTYISNTAPHPHMALLGEHLALVAVVTVALAGLTLWVAGRQEFVPQHGRDQI